MKKREIIGKNELVETELPDSAAVKCKAVTAFKKLVVYDIAVPGTTSSTNPLYYASSFDFGFQEEFLSERGKFTAMRRTRKDAFKILKLLNTFLHPNILMPGGDWETYVPDDSFSSGSEEEGAGFTGPEEDAEADGPEEDAEADGPEEDAEADGPEEDAKSSSPGEEVAKIEAKASMLITFQQVHGLLSELPKDELFIVKEQGANVMHLQGFSQNGLKVWSGLIGAVDHVNENYSNLPAGTLLLPLKLTADKIFYQKTPTGEYHVLVGDFHTKRREYPDLGLQDSMVTHPRAGREVGNGCG